MGPLDQLSQGISLHIIDTQFVAGDLRLLARVRKPSLDELIL
jgi:hypothetical protein